MIQELKKAYLLHLIPWSFFLLLTTISLFIQGEFEIENFLKAFFVLIFLAAPLTTGLFYYYKNIYQPKQINSFLDKLEPISKLGFERDGNIYSKEYKDFHFSISYSCEMKGGSSLIFLTPIIGTQEDSNKLLVYLKNTEIQIMEEGLMLTYTLPLIMNKVPSNNEILKKIEMIIDSTKKFNIESVLEKN
jgi:hypothetical protein